MNVDDSTIGESSAYFGMEPYVRTAFTDRIHDGIYDIDKAHKATLASRLKGNEVRVPHISRYGKRFLGFEASLGREVWPKSKGLTPHRLAQKITRPDYFYLPSRI